MASTFGCGCTAPVKTDELKKLAKYTTLLTVSTQSTDCTDSTPIYNTSYRKATPLFRAIEKERWVDVLRFLSTGKWNTSILFSSNAHLQNPCPEIQAKTWVTLYHKGVPEWSQLPLHAALSYSAPFVVIKKLVELYPKGVQCTDNEGMLPIHLAFGFGASESVLALLLEAFPGSINERGIGGRLPYECCELGPNKVRGRVYQVVAKQTENRVHQQIDKNWRDYVEAAKKKIGVEMEVSKDKKLTGFLMELLQNKKELDELKKSGVVPTPPAHASTSVLARERADAKTEMLSPIGERKASSSSRVRWRRNTGSSRRKISWNT